MSILTRKEKYFHGSDLKLDDDSNDYYILNKHIKPEPGDKCLTFKSSREAFDFIDRCVDYMGDDYSLKRFVFEKMSGAATNSAMTGKALRKLTAELISQACIIAIPKRLFVDEYSAT
jgi:hypothetical protein